MTSEALLLDPPLKQRVSSAVVQSEEIKIAKERHRV